MNNAPRPRRSWLCCVAVDALPLAIAAASCHPRPRPAPPATAPSPVVEPPAAELSTPLLVPLQTKLPRATYDGNWVMRYHEWKVIQGMEDHANGLQRFLVPLGTSNQARGRPVTASDGDLLVGSLEQVTDGDKEGSEGSWVELVGGPQWVQIDLGRPCDIFGILIWHGAGQPTYGKDVVVQVSNDPAFKSGVFTVFNNDHDASIGLGPGHDPLYIEAVGTKVIDARRARARYVRCWSNGDWGDDLNRYVEVEVHGTPAS